MHQMPDPLIIQALNNLNCHADSVFHIFNGTEIIMAVYITAWNAKYQGWYCLLYTSQIALKLLKIEIKFRMTATAIGSFILGSVI